jgi:hypothetical protein
MYNVRDDDFINSVVSKRFEIVNPYVGAGTRIDLYKREFSCENLPFGYTKEFKDLPILVPERGQRSSVWEVNIPRYKLEWELLISVHKYKAFLAMYYEYEALAQDLLVSSLVSLPPSGSLHIHLYDYRIRDLRERNFCKYSMIFTSISSPEVNFLKDSKVIVKLSGETLFTEVEPIEQIDDPLDPDTTIYDYDKDLPPM